MRGIYKITNQKTGKYYVGSSVDIFERWNEHKRSLVEGKHINPKLQGSWNKHGAENFKFEVIEDLGDISRKSLLEVEQKYLEAAKINQSSTYNIKFVANGWDWESGFLMASIRRGSRHNNYNSQIYTFSHLVTGEEFTGTKCDFYTKYKLDKSTVRRVIKGTFKTVKGWTLKSA